MAKNKDTKKKTAEEIQKNMQLRMIPVKELELNEENIRTVYKGIEALAEDIKTNGQKTPLVVMETKDKKSFTPLAGNRRLLAAREAGLENLACIVYPYIKDKKARDQLIIDSGNTMSLDDYDVGLAIQRLKAQGYSDHNIAVTLRGILPQPKGEVAETIEAIEEEIGLAQSDKRKAQLRSELKTAIGNHFRGRIQDRAKVMGHADSSALFHKAIRGTVPDWYDGENLPSVSLAEMKKVADGKETVASLVKKQGKNAQEREQKAELRRIKAARQEVLTKLKSRQFLTLLAFIDGKADVTEEQVLRIDKECIALDGLVKENGHVQKALQKALKA